MATIENRPGVVGVDRSPYRPSERARNKVTTRVYPVAEREPRQDDRQSGAQAVKDARAEIAELREQIAALSERVMALEIAEAVRLSVAQAMAGLPPAAPRKSDALLYR